ncbi:MAG: metallophosphoesterase [Dehalobacter sp.]|nr:metallophosphoesterase [Dehalobacter sp.]
MSNMYHDGLKIVVTGDLHFRSENPRSRKDAFEDAMLSKLLEVFQLAQEHGAEAIIIPGDIFDTANVGLKAIAKLGYCLNTWIDEFNVQVLTISGNHDLPAGNKAALERTPYGLLSKLGFIHDLEEENFETHFNINFGDMKDVYLTVSGCGFDFQTDTSEGVKQYSTDRYDEDTVGIHVVHSMLMATPPITGMRHAIIDEVETDADIIISGHYHDGFGVIRRKNGKLFINPGALCRLSASEAEMKRTIQVALLTVRSKTDFEAELIPLQSARPADEVLDREAIVEKKEHENWLETFFESLQQDGEAKFLEVQEIVENMANLETLSPGVKDEALRRISEAREKLGRVAV